MPLIPFLTNSSPTASLFAAAGSGGGGGGGGVTNVNNITGAVVISAGSNITLSNPEGNVIEITASGGGGGGITPVQTQPALVIPFPIVCPAGTTTTVCNSETLTAGHTYTASITLNYKNAGEGVSAYDGINVSFINPSSGYGSITSPIAYQNGANLGDGATQLFTATWYQADTRTKCGLYITPSGSGYDVTINQIQVDIDGVLTITDWGAL